MEKLSQVTIPEFAAVLASKEPVPGGGGASALMGALGAALASMVCNLTIGKKKYAEFEETNNKILDEANKLRGELLDLIDADAEAFFPLSKAYGIPKDDPTRESVMEEALKGASQAPMGMMRIAARCIELHHELMRTGSALVISDVGVGVECCRAAVKGASLNVFINAKDIKDRAYADAMTAEAKALIEKSNQLADEIFSNVVSRF